MTDPTPELHHEEQDRPDDAAASFLESFSELLSKPAPAEEPAPPVPPAAQSPYSDPHWQPMLALFGSGIASQFHWAVTTGVIETYEHRETLRYLHIDSVTGECLNQRCEVVSSESALHHAFQSRPQPVPAPPAEVIPATEPAPAVSTHQQASGPDANEPLLNSFLRTSEDPAEESTPESEPPPTAPYATVLENLQGLLQPAMRVRLRSLLRTKTLPARKAQSISADASASELNFASFTRRHSAF